MNGNALSGPAVGRLVTVCAVLAGLFAMHGLPEQGCSSGSGALISSMAHHASIAAAADTLTLASGATSSSISRPRTQSVSTIGANGQPGQMCLANPPAGWARLLALLMGISILGLTTALRLPPTVMHPDNRRRAPPLAGSGVLKQLCVSRT